MHNSCSTVHLFYPCSSLTNPFTVPYTIFSKCMTFHKGIHHLDHLCPYNSVEKDNIRKIILVLGRFSAVVWCCTEPALGLERAGITNSSQCNAILPQVLYGELIRPLWLWFGSAMVAISGISSAESTKNSGGRKKCFSHFLAVVHEHVYRSCSVVHIHWSQGALVHEKQTNMQEINLKCVWQGTKFLPSHSALLRASCPQGSFCRWIAV